MLYRRPYMEKFKSELNEASKDDEFRTMSEAEAMAYLETVDKESQTRSLSGIVKLLFFFACVVVSLYHLYTSFAGTPPVVMHRSLHVGMMLALGFILYPIGKKANRKKVAFYDWIFFGLALVIPFYVWFHRPKGLF